MLSERVANGTVGYARYGITVLAKEMNVKQTNTLPGALPGNWRWWVKHD